MKNRAISSFAPLLILLFLSSVNPAYAQFPAPSGNQQVTTDSVKYAFLPALAYNSDLGLIGGGILSRYHYTDDVTPFYSYLNLNAIASTKGLLSFLLMHDKPKVFGSNMRLSSEIVVSRFMENQFYGIGNYQQVDGHPEETPDYYLYKSFTTNLEFILRRPLLYNTKTNGQVDVFGLAGFSYRTPWGNGPNRLISIEQPEGMGGTHIAELGTGFIWENRDSEFLPTQGSYVRAGVITGQEFLGSNHNYLRLETEARSYASFHFLRQITFASKLSFIHTNGDLPYWKLAEMGGSDTMRGYPENRFVDDNALLLNSELRTWLLNLPAYDIRFGGTIFADIGRTFPNGMALDNVFNDLKYAAGFGGTLSLFTQDFILRTDIGFSEEGYGIYFTSGYMF